MTPQSPVGPSAPPGVCVSPPPSVHRSKRHPKEHGKSSPASPTVLPMLTPPRTRDTRMDDPLASRRACRHARHGSDSSNPLHSPLAHRYRHSGTTCTDAYPVRDTPNNPFIEGGPADAGYTGPNTKPSLPHKYKLDGHTTYLFRGQRVVCDDGETDSMLRHHIAARGIEPFSPPEPKLLFPSRNVANTEVPSARLFSYELESQRHRDSPLCAMAEDPDAIWFADGGRKSDDATPGAILGPSTGPFNNSAQTDLLLKLEQADWSSDDDDDDDHNVI